MTANSIYSNSGHSDVVQLLEPNENRILDVGCGSGSTAEIIRLAYPDAQITGITCSAAERDLAATKMVRCYCMDIEREPLDTLFGSPFDVILLLHVLEHLVDPCAVVRRLLPLLKPSGKTFIAVPNVVNWRTRLSFLFGRFEYSDAGVLDRTHLHFYTAKTAQSYLVNPVCNLKVERRVVRGSIPLGPFRHYLFPRFFSKKLDNLGCALFPNLFGAEIMLICSKLPYTPVTEGRACPPD